MKVQPGAQRTEIAGYENGVLRMRVTAPPEKGRANEAVVELLAAVLSVPKRDVSVVGGVASREKVVAVAGMDEAEVRKRIEPQGH